MIRTHVFAALRSASRGRVFAAAIAVACLGLQTSSLHATPLLPGTSEAGGSIGATNALDGNLLDSLSAPFSVPTTSGTFSGVLTTHVYENDSSNPHGGLTFTFQLSNNSGSAAPINRLTLNDFDDFATNVSYQEPASGLIPLFVDRSTDGEVLGFLFYPPPFGVLTPGSTSALFVVHTDAPAYRESFASVIDGVTASVPTFAPVPEPSSLVLLGLGSLVAGAYGLRRRKTRQ